MLHDGAQVGANDAAHAFELMACDADRA
jgi:hypothetical protein